MISLMSIATGVGPPAVSEGVVGSAMFVAVDCAMIRTIRVQSSGVVGVADLPISDRTVDDGRPLL